MENKFNSFDGLSTVLFQKKLKPHALEIYNSIFKGCIVEDLRTDGVKVHVLDKEFGIDSLIKFKSGQWISLQEKYRSNYYLRYGDFTQEFKNGVGTLYESDGEWFKLGAQLYFYGWANETNTGFSKWIILNIAAYKELVEINGGLQNIGKLRQNNLYGKASFYSIPLDKLKPAIIYSSC